MKKTPILIIFSFLLTLVSCYNRIAYFSSLTVLSFPATSPDSIKLYYAPDKPDKPFEVIGSVKIIVHGMSPNETKALTDMKKEAALRGADAILNITISDAGFDPNNGVRDGSFVGLAVKWK